MERFDESVSPLAFAGRQLVRCPSCGRQARLTRSEWVPQQPIVSRATCTHCGFAREWSSKGDGRPREAVDAVPGAVCDYQTGLALWLQAPCCGETLWAFNEEHLDFLRDYVGATLRERHVREGLDGRLHIDTYYGRIPAALPTWMKLAKHRAEVLATIEHLRGTIEP